MTVYCLPPPARVEAAAKTVEDWIKGQEAAAGLDDAMKVVRDWVQGNEDRRRRLNEIRICHEH
jgi:hypothetical protein